ncbi:MAG: MoxR family ATPase [Clostridiales bacterium]|nr:MoxR family ATPase [Clostridiales bacterium]
MVKITDNIVSEVKKVICGKDTAILYALNCMLSGGNLLIEDVPGVGKTTLALALSRTMGLDCGRVQFTPDVLPSDITGFSVYDKLTNTMKYQPGAIFHNLFLADELNRASSRTQSALLEAMEEGHVTVDGNTYLLPKPFTVFATQNPVGTAGTSLLPDSQVDRFMVRLSIGYPSPKDERAMIDQRKTGIDPLSTVVQICDRNMLSQMQQEVNAVYIHEKVVNYIVELIHKSRSHKDLERGASPRATLALTAMAKGAAYLEGRNYVTPSDVHKIFVPVIAHRLILTPEAELEGKNTADIAKQLLKNIVTPKI